eukprot:TRINITY_DN69881_c0_g1_i1.p2 TRINITY_DN69881_c0_g1~~TRINITY_DN69881_c0_g1_i1.p2  ORF type:complete len:149 (+),score=10.75 TRINITY_DN69881_c0_g1_i1:68-514(+)
MADIPKPLPPSAPPSRSSWDDKMRHLDPQIGSQYDLIAVNPDVKTDDSIYDAVRYVCRTVKEEQALPGIWLSPLVEDFTEQPDVTRVNHGFHMTLKVMLKPSHSGPGGAYGDSGFPYTLNCHLRKVAGEWFMVRYSIHRDREALSPTK